MRFGIDFGTTHTVVALVDRGNYPIVSFEHRDVIPSIVSVDPSGALRFGHAEPGWPVLRSFKRLLDAARTDTEVELAGRRYALTDLLTQFLAYVRDEIAHHSNAGLRKGEAIEVAVSVPANASTAQRLMTMDAYRRAGFEVKAVLNEPSAAGFEYAHRFRETVTSKREYVLVYDLGGGTFDASLIHMEGRSNEVITSCGVSRLGGDDFDETIARLVLARHGGEVTRTLLDDVRGQKESINPNTRRFVVDVGEKHIVLPIEDVFEACARLVEQTLLSMEPAMRDPRRGDDPVPWSELAGIYVVGGASSFPPVYRRLRERFGAHRVRRSPHPFGSCAIGLAIHLDESAGYKLSERLSRHFGVFREERAGERILVRRAGAEGHRAAGRGVAAVPRGAQRRALPIRRVRPHRARPPRGQPRRLGRVPLSLRSLAAQRRSLRRRGAPARRRAGGRGGVSLRRRRHRRGLAARARRRLRADRQIGAPLTPGATAGGW